MADDAPLTFAQKLTHRNTLLALGGGLVFGAVGAFAGWSLWIVPQRDLARLRYAAMQDVLKIYSLQVEFKRTRGVYAGDLDALLFSAPDRAELKARFGSHVDLNTLAVVSLGDKFKVEANVLDKDRTLIKIKGPPDEWHPRVPGAIPVETGAGTDSGAPIQTGPAR